MKPNTIKTLKTTLLSLAALSTSAYGADTSVKTDEITSVEEVMKSPKPTMDEVQQRRKDAVKGFKHYAPKAPYPLATLVLFVLGAKLFNGVQTMLSKSVSYRFGVPFLLSTASFAGLFTTAAVHATASYFGFAGFIPPTIAVLLGLAVHAVVVHFMSRLDLSAKREHAKNTWWGLRENEQVKNSRISIALQTWTLPLVAFIVLVGLGNLKAGGMKGYAYAKALGKIKSIVPSDDKEDLEEEPEEEEEAGDDE